MKISEFLLDQFFQAHSIDGFSVNEPANHVLEVDLLKNGMSLIHSDQQLLLQKMIGFPYASTQAAIVDAFEKKYKRSRYEVPTSNKDSFHARAKELSWYDSYLSRGRALPKTVLIQYDSPKNLEGLSS